jgi:radical SAM-linked protein
VNPPLLPKIRIRYTKYGKVRFTSHRDMARVWERNLRKIGFPVAYSEGFSPRPKLSFGLALPTGAESDGEYFDISVDPSWDRAALDELPSQLNAVLPAGISVQAVAVLPPGSESLQSVVTSSTWAIELADIDLAQAHAWVSRVLDADELVVSRERKGKVVIDDLRPEICSLEATELAFGAPGLVAELSTIGRALRPSELLTVIEPHLHGGLIRRRQQWISVDGARSEPLVARAAVDHRTPVGVR